MDCRTIGGWLAAFMFVGCLPELRIIPCRDGSTCSVRDRQAIDDAVHDEVVVEPDARADAHIADVHDGTLDVASDAAGGCASDRAECSGRCVLL